MITYGNDYKKYFYLLGVGLAILGGAAKGALASALTRGAGNQHSLEVQVISTNQRSR